MTLPLRPIARNNLFLSGLMFATACVFAACSEDPPTKPSPAANLPAIIQIEGPESLRVGQSAQFVAYVQLSDGTRKQATTMRWSSADPFVMSVSNAGVVTANRVGLGGEYIIAEADTSTLRPIRGIRTVRVLPNVTGDVEISQRGTPGQLEYVFTATLTELAGVSTTVSGVWISFDDSWGKWCSWTPDKLVHTRVSANGTLALDPLTCGSPDDAPFNVVVEIGLKDDNGKVSSVYLYRAPVLH